MCIDASKCKQWNVRQYLKRCWINFHTERSIDDGMSILETRKSMDSWRNFLVYERFCVLRQHQQNNQVWWSTVVLLSLTTRVSMPPNANSGIDSTWSVAGSTSIQNAALTMAWAFWRPENQWTQSSTALPQHGALSYSYGTQSGLMQMVSALKLPPIVKIVSMEILNWQQKDTTHWIGHVQLHKIRYWIFTDKDRIISYRE